MAIANSLTAARTLLNKWLHCQQLTAFNIVKRGDLVVSQVRDGHAVLHNNRHKAIRSSQDKTALHLQAMQRHTETHSTPTQGRTLG